MRWGFDMTEQKRAIVINETVQVSDDDFSVMVIVTRPPEPVIDRDMDTIKGEVERLLPAWIKTKIQAGEP
jgi:hypothetical protein